MLGRPGLCLCLASKFVQIILEYVGEAVLYDTGCKPRKGWALHAIVVRPHLDMPELFSARQHVATRSSFRKPE